MGDRSSVSLYFLNEHSSKIKEIYKTGYSEMGEFNWITETTLNYIFFSEVSYGQLHDLDLLIQAGIPFESIWEGSYKYEEGTRYCRFTPEGDLIDKTVYVNDINPPLHELLALCDKPHELVEFVKKHNANISVPGWENQIEYGKLYRTKRLICQA